MMYLGSSYAVPAFLSFMVFLAWAVVWSRMSNLHIRYLYRLLVFLWASAFLAMAIDDLIRPHYAETELVIVKAVIYACITKLGCIGLAFAVYRMLGQLYPERMAASPCEATPAGYCAR